MMDGNKKLTDDENNRPTIKMKIFNKYIRYYNSFNNYISRFGESTHKSYHLMMKMLKL